MIKQAIIPLAGLGTRLLPLTSVFAKELLPINGKPGIEYILDECIEAGIKEIIFIISNKKIMIKKKEDKKLTKDQAEKKILTLKKDLFNIRFKKVNNQINNPAQYNEIKKSIARLYTTIKNSK